MFIIEDETHSEYQEGKFPTLADAIAELERRAMLPWDKAPNQAPCTSWRTCGRRYEIVEFDSSVRPWRELQRLPFLSISASGIEWLLRRRPSARLLVLDPAGRVLLFRFVHKNDALVGRDYWATPGGGLEAGETFAQAAIRELREETGICVVGIGPEVGRREFVLQVPSGEHVMAEERYFLVRSADAALSRDEWSADEAKVMAEHKWWSPDELARTSATVWPEDLLALLDSATA